MPSAVRLREDYSAEELRALARRSKDVNQSRRLLSLAAVRDGMDRGAAAKIGGMDRQTLSDWVHRYNVTGASTPRCVPGARATQGFQQSLAASVKVGRSGLQCR